MDLSPSDRAPGGEVRVLRSSGASDAGADAGSDAGVVAPAVLFTAPMDGASFAQDRFIGGEWAASVAFEVSSEAVARVELVAGGVSLGDVVDGSLTYVFFGDGSHTVVATGYDAAGLEVASDSVTITVEPPIDTSCQGTLTAIGLDWEVAGATRGIADPVRVQPIINGVAFRYISRTEPTAMLMDCSLAISLFRLTEVLLPYGIDEVVHIGIYNYRCIGGGDPDSGTCTPSQHAYARGIDFAAFGLAGSDDTLSLEDDWNITTRGDDCPIPSSSDKDRILKELACTMWSERIFSIVLTPNYNAGHRTHFHVDLTEGSMYLGEGVAGVDPPIGGLGD